MKRLLYKIRMWLLGLLHGEPEECAEKTKDAYMDYISEQRKQISMLVEAIALYKNAIREICRRSKNTYATAISVTAGVTILNLCAMENDCRNCPDRTVKCHVTCERYKAFCERNEAIKAARRADYSPKDILVTGYIKRAKAVRTKTHKMVWRYRGT